MAGAGRVPGSSSEPGLARVGPPRFRVGDRVWVQTGRFGVVVGRLRRQNGGGWWDLQMEGVEDVLKARTTHLVPLPEGAAEQDWRRRVVGTLFAAGTEPTDSEPTVLHVGGVACPRANAGDLPAGLAGPERTALRRAVLARGGAYRALDCVRAAARAVLSRPAWEAVGSLVVVFADDTLGDLRVERPETLGRLPRRAVQALAKRHGVQANQSTPVLLARLSGICLRRPSAGSRRRERVLALRVARALGLDRGEPALRGAAMAVCRRLVAWLRGRVLAHVSHEANRLYRHRLRREGRLPARRARRCAGCATVPANAVYPPCGHAVFCNTCAGRWGTGLASCARGVAFRCPLCRRGSAAVCWFTAKVAEQDAAWRLQCARHTFGLRHRASDAGPAPHAATIVV